LDKKEFARRRRAIMEEMGEGSIAILPAAPVRERNRDVEYPYRQDSDFYYLTGYEEPEAVAVLLPKRKRGEFVLFCRERDPEMELWNGKRSGLEGACAEHGADDAFPIGDIDDILPGLLENQSRVYYAMGYYSDFDRRMIGWVNRVRTRSKAGVTSPAEFVALDNVLHEMRLVKSKGEIRAMTRAMEISSDAHIRAMGACRPGMTEYEIEAELNYAFMRAGSRRAAYPSIVAGGANACVLHYIENRDTLRAGDLLLIDAGAEYDYYASDITRTFPVNGRFSKTQRALYDVVLEAQEAAIEMVKPGNHWNEPHEAAVEVLAEGLVALGLIKGRASTVIKKGRYRKFYVHRTGHWLGMDVHDVGDYKIEGEWRVLEPGMVMTVEPGLYVAPGDKQVARKWWNTGIRIEDDVLVTRTGNKVLTAAAPKSVDDIEAIVGKG
jgi:Xaa-Pro aminopeptidase